MLKMQQKGGDNTQTADGQVFLEITAGAGAASRVELGSEPLTIGRQIANRVVLDDAEASRFHCVVERVAGAGFRVRDLGSRNGTKVNGKLVKTALLRDDDVIQVGHVQMKLVSDNGKKQQPEVTSDQGGGWDFGAGANERSEEHTSELQSPCNVVCRLLLENKNV